MAIHDGTNLIETENTAKVNGKEVSMDVTYQPWNYQYLIRVFPNPDDKRNFMEIAVPVEMIQYSHRRY